MVIAFQTVVIEDTVAQVGDGGCNILLVCRQAVELPSSPDALPRRHVVVEETKQECLGTCMQHSHSSSSDFIPTHVICLLSAQNTFAFHAVHSHDPVIFPVGSTPDVPRRARRVGNVLDQVV